MLVVFREAIIRLTAEFFTTTTTKQNKPESNGINSLKY